MTKVDLKLQEIATFKFEGRAVGSEQVGFVPVGLVELVSWRPVDSEAIEDHYRGDGIHCSHTEDLGIDIDTIGLKGTGEVNTH